MRGLFAVALLLLAGCAGNGADETDTDSHTSTMATSAQTSATGPADSGTTAATSSGPRDPVTWQVEVRDNSYSPASLTIQAGDTVRWVQVGSNPHTVTADDGAWDSHPQCASFADSLMGNCMAEDDTFEQTFEEAGEVGYHCKIHGSAGSGMAGTVEVRDRHDATP